MSVLTIEQGVNATANFYNDIDIGFCIIKVEFDEQHRRADYRFVEVNAAFEQHTGLIDVTGQWMRNLAPDHEQFWFDRYTEIARTGRPARFEYSAQALGGRHFEVYAYRTGEPEQQRVAVLFADISVRKHQEALRSALYHLTDQLAEYEDVAGLTDVACGILGRTLNVQLVGYGLVDLGAETITVERDWTSEGAQSIVGTLNFRDFGSYIDDLKHGETVVVHDARTDPRTQDTAAALEAINARALVNEAISEHGHFVALLFVCTSKPRSWSEDELLFIREVAARIRTATARRMAELALRASETARAETLMQEVAERTAAVRLYRDIVQSDKAPIVAFDHGYRVLAFNQAHDEDFQRVMGRRQEIGDVLPDLFPPDQATALKGLMDRALAGERFVIIQRFGEPGREMPTWEITYTPLRGGDGQVVGAFHHARDISERVRAEGELSVTQEALRQAQKMEAVGQLTGGVAHDFNNLLTVIKSSSDLLKRPDLAEERRARYVSAISDTVERAAKLTGQLLAFARRQALKPVVFDASESVRALSDMMGTLTGSRVHVSAQLPAKPCFINADPSQFDTALVNMAVNARDAMDGEGRIVITVAEVEAVPAIRLHAAQDGPYVAVSLSDTGSGIAPGQVERIFEPFFTTKEVGKGTGLGLSQVFGFAKQSGGDISVASTVGEGTTFTLYLPRVPAPEHVVAPEEPEALVDGHGTRVLVVEDNADVGTFAVQSLTDLGYQTVLAADGAAALAELAKDPRRFDVVFSDVVMPGMSGIDLGQEIRMLYGDLPVVLTSGYSHVLAQNGTYGFELLHKPYSIEQLSQILRKVAHWQRRKRLVSG